MVQRKGACHGIVRTDIIGLGCSLVAAFFVASTPALASDATGELLRSREVKNIVISVREDNKLQAAADEDFPIDSGQTVLGSDIIKLSFDGFKPLQYDVSIDVKTEPDPNYKQLQEFIASLGKMGDVTKNVIQSTFEDGVRADAGYENSPPMFRIDDIKSCPLLADKLSSINNFLREIVISNDEVRQWQSAAVDNTTSVTVSRQIDDKITRVGTALKAVKAEVSALRTLLIAEKQPTDVDFSQCDAMDLELIRSLVLNRLMDDHLEATSDMVASLKTVGERLKNLKWSQDGKRFILRSVTPSYKEQLVVTITLKKLTISSDWKHVAISSSPTTTSFSFVIRRAQPIIVEAGAALVFTSLTAPKYGTTTVMNPVTAQEEQQVKLVDRQAFDVKGALFLNLISNRSRNIPVHVMGQVGFSNGPNLPIGFLGLGLRLSDAPISASVGIAASGVNDLKTLQEGDVVSGTVDIENDLALRPALGGYGALQLSF